jgi:hypothetical protein
LEKEKDVLEKEKYASRSKNDNYFGIKFEL